MRNILTAQLSATEQILSQLSDEIENSGEIEPQYNKPPAMCCRSSAVKMQTQ